MVDDEPLRARRGVVARAVVAVVECRARPLEVMAVPLGVRHGCGGSGKVVRVTVVGDWHGCGGLGKVVRAVVVRDWHRVAALSMRGSTSAAGAYGSASRETSTGGG